MRQHRSIAPAVTANRHWTASRYWIPFAVALVLLLVVDPVTTLWAVAEYGPGGEANPLMRWVIQQGPVAVGLVNVAALVACLYCFARVVKTIRIAPDPYDRYLAIGVDLWLTLLIAVGVFVCANNLSVVLRGSSLL